MAVVPQATPKPSTAKAEWSPRFWLGMTAPGWWRLLRRNRFAVDWRYWHIAAAITALSLFHSVWGVWQSILIGWWLRKAKVTQPPLFILGHWRAGTTLLHEMMVLDERHTSPSTYACLAPNHFLITEAFSRRWLNFLLPAHRPMDNMPAGWERPQEEEFALCNLGLRSPYLTIAFPRHPPQDQEYLTFEGVPTEERETWKRGLMRFLSHVNYAAPKRIVLKNPPHTARVDLLLEMFPDAQFIHIVRDPYVVFASTVHLWKKLYTTHGLQNPSFDGLEEHVWRTFERMYAKFERDRDRIPPGRLHEMSYESLVRNPESEIRTIYERLGLGDFEQIRPALLNYLAANDGYQTNRHQLTDEQRATTARRWGDFIRRYGYEQG